MCRLSFVSFAPEITLTRPEPHASKNNCEEYMLHQNEGNGRHETSVDMQRLYYCTGNYSHGNS